MEHLQLVKAEVQDYIPNFYAETNTLGNKRIVGVIACSLFQYAGHSLDAWTVKGFVVAAAGHTFVAVTIVDLERQASCCHSLAFLLDREQLGDTIRDWLQQVQGGYSLLCLLVEPSQ